MVGTLPPLRLHPSLVLSLRLTVRRLHAPFDIDDEVTAFSLVFIDHLCLTISAFRSHFIYSQHYLYYCLLLPCDFILEVIRNEKRNMF